MARRLCGGCYTRARTAGTLPPLTDRGVKGRTSENHLASARVGRAEDECWPWPGPTTSSGYGVFRDGSRSGTPANRVALSRALGRPLQPGEQALHRCDNPPCVNPAHLFAGTHLDNMRDMRCKRRQPNLKLSDDDVLAIRQSYFAGGVTQLQLADRFGISRSHCSKLIRADWQPGTARSNVSGPPGRWIRNYPGSERACDSCGRVYSLPPTRRGRRKTCGQECFRAVNAAARTGSGNGQARLTETQVSEIRARLRDGAMGKAIAADFGVSPMTISRIRRGQRWTHVA